MRRVLFTLLALLLTAFAQDPRPHAGPRFVAFDVFVDAGGQRLGAWQFEWLVPGGGASIVGVEGGDGVFAPAPFYDPAALQGGRILIAAFSTDASLPRGRARVATVHLLVEPDRNPVFAATLQACADGDGKAIAAAITWNPKEGK